MAIYYSSMNRGKVVKLPVQVVPRSHAAVARGMQALQEHTGRVIQAAELFRPKLIES